MANIIDSPDELTDAIIDMVMSRKGLDDVWSNLDFFIRKEIMEDITSLIENF